MGIKQYNHHIRIQNYNNRHVYACHQHKNRNAFTRGDSSTALIAATKISYSIHFRILFHCPFYYDFSLVFFSSAKSIFFVIRFCF